MDDLNFLKELLIVPGYRDDEAVKYICETLCDERNRAVSAYSRLCGMLVSERSTLSDHIFHICTDRSGCLFSDRKNAEHQMSIMSRFAGISCAELVSVLRKRFSIDENVPFPVYETGDTEISYDSVSSFINRYGSSVFADHKAFRCENGLLAPVEQFDGIRLTDLKNYEAQRQRVIDNTLCFINGQKYSNVLLYGDRGTGKSSTVKAVVNEYDDLRIVLITKSEIPSIYDIYDTVKDLPLKFILFLDDLTFGDNEQGYSILKQALEGSVNVMPRNCAIYATTNRRHIIKETSSEREDEHNEADARDEKVSLSDRFGLYITFMSPDKKTYLDIVRKLADDRNLVIDDEKLCMLAEKYALRKGGRSPRTAGQFVDSAAARTALGLPLENI